MTVCYGSVHGAVIQIGIRKQPHFTGSELNGAKPVTPRGAGSTAFISPIEFPWGGGEVSGATKGIRLWFEQRPSGYEIYFKNVLLEI